MLTLLVISLLIPYTPVSAQAGEREEEFRANNILFYDGGDYECVSSVGTSIPPGKIYIVGDSITAGATGYLKDKFVSPWSTDDNHINGVKSRHVTEGVTAINSDGAFIADSKAIIIELGTNDFGSDFSASIKNIIGAIKQYNLSAPIFWVDIAVTTGDATPGNSAIYNLAEEEGYTVIPWFKAVFPDSNPTLTTSTVDTNDYLADGVHPTVAGYELLTQTIYDTISTTTTSTGASSMSLAGDNVAKAFNFFIQKGFSNEQTAGILGNLAGESGLNPQNVQNSYTKRTGTEDGEHNPLDLWWWGTDDDGNQARRDAGYGIAQWTSFSRKERFAALAEYRGPDKEGNIYGSLGNQLDLVWYELTGEPVIPNMTGGNYGFAYDHLISTATIAEATISWVQNYERPRSLIENEDKGYDFLVELYRNDRIKHAKEIYNQYAGKFSAGTGCSGVATSGVVGTALLYSWPDVQTPSANPIKKPEYQDALDIAIANGEYVGGGRFPGVDCGGFVTRVMRDSGYDANYNSSNGNTYYQNIYLQENWRVIEVNDTSDLQPGDVAMRRRENSGHTFMWVGEQPGFETSVASAAYDGNSENGLDDWRAPAAGHENPLDSSFTWYRRM